MKQITTNRVLPKHRKHIKRWKNPKTTSFTSVPSEPQPRQAAAIQNKAAEFHKLIREMSDVERKMKKLFLDMSGLRVSINFGELRDEVNDDLLMVYYDLKDIAAPQKRLCSVIAKMKQPEYLLRDVAREKK